MALTRSGATLLAMVLAIGCGKTKKPGPVERDPAPTRVTPSNLRCETLDRAECLSAMHCTLHRRSNLRYDCRPAVGPCETGLLQRDRKGCGARSGCVWSPGRGYCAFPGYGRTAVEDKSKNPGGACGRAGGYPPSCQRSATEDAASNDK